MTNTSSSYPGSAAPAPKAESLGLGGLGLVRGVLGARRPAWICRTATYVSLSAFRRRRVRGRRVGGGTSRGVIPGNRQSGSRGVRVLVAGGARDLDARPRLHLKVEGVGHRTDHQVRAAQSDKAEFRVGGGT